MPEFKISGSTSRLFAAVRPPTFCVLLAFGLLASGLVILGASRLLQLSKKVIDLDELRILAAQDVADAAGVRATVWKVLDWFASYIF
jgi:hypothetical protein